MIDKRIAKLDPLVRLEAKLLEETGFGGSQRVAWRQEIRRDFLWLYESAVRGGQTAAHLPTPWMDDIDWSASRDGPANGPRLT
jgi:hypothetical protein